LIKIKWDEKALKSIYPLKFIDDKVKRKVEEEVAKLDVYELTKLREYEETWDEYVLREPNLMMGILVKIVKHKGSLKLIARIFGYPEEYFIGEI